MIWVSGVEYKCFCDILQAEAVGVNRYFDDATSFLGFRNIIEVNGERHALRRITFFNWSNVVAIYIPNNVESIGKECFSTSDSAYEIVFESDSELKEIGDGAFADSGIKTIRIPSSVEKIGKKCFQMCESIREFVFDSDSELNKIGNRAFSKSGLKSIRISNNFQKIQKYSFFGCKSLCEVVFESDSKLREIGYGAFSCSGLKSILIPRSVENIEDRIKNVFFSHMSFLGYILASRLRKRLFKVW
jgi:hypothetical protein